MVFVSSFSYSGHVLSCGRGQCRTVEKPFQVFLKRALPLFLGKSNLWYSFGVDLSTLTHSPDDCIGSFLILRASYCCSFSLEIHLHSQGLFLRCCPRKLRLLSQTLFSLAIYGFLMKPVEGAERVRESPPKRLKKYKNRSSDA